MGFVWKAAKASFGDNNWVFLSFNCCPPVKPSLKKTAFQQLSKSVKMSKNQTLKLSPLRKRRLEPFPDYMIWLWSFLRAIISLRAFP